MRDVLIIVGQSGSGKSHFTKNVILPEYPRKITYDPMNEYEGQYFPQLDELIDHCLAHPVFSVRTDDFESFDLICETAYNIENCCLTVEEIQRVVMPGQKPPPEFLDIVFRGRHKNVSLIAIAQRASSININIRSQFTRFISFRQSEPNDLSYIYDICGQREIVEQLPFLELGEYVEINNSGTTIIKSKTPALPAPESEVEKQEILVDDKWIEIDENNA